jgi:hypothetical protein
MGEERKRVVSPPIQLGLDARQLFKHVLITILITSATSSIPISVITTMDPVSSPNPLYVQTTDVKATQ